MKRLIYILLTFLQLPAVLMVGALNIVEGLFVASGCIGFLVITITLGVVGGIIFVFGMVLLFGLVRAVMIPYVNLLERVKMNLKSSPKIKNMNEYLFEDER